MELQDVIRGLRDAEATRVETPRQHVTALRLNPIRSAQDGVRAAIVKEFRSLEPAE
jgi:hypothetical protein